MNCATKLAARFFGLFALTLITGIAGCAPSADAPQDKPKLSNAAPETVPVGNSNADTPHPTELPETGTAANLPAARPVGGAATVGTGIRSIRKRR